MMKAYLVAIFMIVSCVLFGQQGDSGYPKALHKSFTNFLNSTAGEVFPSPNIQKLRKEDAINDKNGIGPWRFGYNHPVHLDMDHSGTWINLPDGSSLWLLKLTCKNALSINLTFEEVILPEGNEMFIYNPEKDFILGSFRDNHLYKGQLGTELIPGETAIVEYYIPSKNKSLPHGLTLTTVTHGYRKAEEFHLKAFGGSDVCNLNVNCPEGALWTKEKNAVVMLVSGSNGFCSGALVNNTLDPGRPFVLTAEHCYSDPATWVFRFNWQSSDCSNPPSSPTFQSLSGAILRAKATASDFCLVEITGGLQNGTVPTAYNPYFAGWDNSGNTPLSGVGIHHPSGDIKKISIEHDPLLSTSFKGGPVNTHWSVNSWDKGVTEGGSSGSPLFDQNHRIVGQLHGGLSSCGGTQQSDEYGKFSHSWNPNGSNSTNQLKYWLDPSSSGAQFIDGYDPSSPAAVKLDAGISSPKGVSGTFCSGTLSPELTLFNAGSSILTSAVIYYGMDGIQDQIYYWSGSLSQWQMTAVSLPPINVSSGLHTFSATIGLPNSGADENNQNNKVNSSFTVVLNGQSVVLKLDLDCFGSETSWDLTDGLNGKTLFSGNGYVDDAAITVTEEFCLNEGCFAFTIRDAYGDGMVGCSPENGGSGSFEITWNGYVLASLSESKADFGKDSTQRFCLPVKGVDSLDEQLVRIYPNPANEKVVISAHKAHPIKNIVLWDVSGKLCLEESPLPSEWVSLDLTPFASGYYTLQIELAGTSVFKKLIIE